MGPMTNVTNDRPYTDAISRLRAAGLRPTRQRMALAKLLFDGDDRHVTAEMLRAEATEAKVSVSLATVYNTLHQFTDVGLLREIVVDSQRSYFDTNTGDHHHFYFEDTKHLEDIPGEFVSISGLPSPPEDATVTRIDVIVRMTKNDKNQ